MPESPVYQENASSDWRRTPWFSHFDVAMAGSPRLQLRTHSKLSLFRVIPVLAFLGHTLAPAYCLTSNAGMMCHIGPFVEAIQNVGPASEMESTLGPLMWQLFFLSPHQEGLWLAWLMVEWWDTWGSGRLELGVGYRGTEDVVQSNRS